MEIPSPESSPKTNGVNAVNGTKGMKGSIVDTLEAVVNGEHADVKSAGV